MTVMTETKEVKDLKEGEQFMVEIGDQILTIEPVPYGNIKKLFKIVIETIGEFTKESGEAALLKVPRIMEERMGIVLPLLFRKGTHDFITDEWIDENLTVIDMRKIITAAIKVNGLQDFFAKAGKLSQGLPQETIRPTV